jgi:uncharacterized surface protein with fasciclin (FAS1) repeats
MKSKPAEKVLMGASPSSTGPVPKANGRTGNGSPASRPKRAAERETGWRPKENILEMAAATGRFETLGRAIEAAGLASKLSERGPFTLFAPTDKAFAKLPAADLAALLANKAEVRRMLGSHVVPSAVRAPRKSAPSQVKTLDGKEHDLVVVAEDGGYRISDARIVKTNIRASNGVIHAIDTVLTAG